MKFNVGVRFRPIAFIIGNAAIRGGQPRMAREPSGCPAESLLQNTIVLIITIVVRLNSRELGNYHATKNIFIPVERP